VPQFVNGQQFQAVPQFQQTSHYNQAPQYDQKNMDPEGNKGGFTGRGRGEMGKGKSPIILNNCQQQGYYARDYPQATTTCMYCHTTDHVKEECLKLMTKIQEKRNINNQNVQWIVAEIRDPVRT